MTVRVLALDLERTLISDAMNANPRPGLFEFLEFCESHFERILLFTCVDESDAWEVLTHLTNRGYVPPQFLDRLEYISWDGEHKDLKFIPNAVPDEVLLIDDDAGWIHPKQRDRWIAIPGWDAGEDHELQRLQLLLEEKSPRIM